MPIREKNGEVGVREPNRTYETQQGGVPALEVRGLKESWVFPYTHLLHSCLNPSQDLIITFVSHQVVVSGRNLQVLHQSLALLSLKMIEPTDFFVPSAEEGSVQIESIKVVVVSGVDNFEIEG